MEVVDGEAAVGEGGLRLRSKKLWIGVLVGCAVEERWWTGEGTVWE